MEKRPRWVRMAAGIWLLWGVCGLLAGCAFQEGPQGTTEPSPTAMDLPAAPFTIDGAPYGGIRDIAADAEDRLYLAGEDGVFLITPQGEPAGRMVGPEDCAALACQGDVLYALEQEGTEWVLTGYDRDGGEERSRCALSFSGAPQSLAAVEDALLLFTREEDAMGGIRCYRIDPAQGKAEAFPAGEGMDWAAPLEDGRILLGGIQTVVTDREGASAAAQPWAGTSTSGCRMQDGSAIYCIMEQTLSAIDVEGQLFLTAGILDDDRLVRRLVGGTHMLYAIDAEGAVACIPVSGLVTEPQETLTLALPQIPLYYLRKSIQDYMRHNPGVLIQTVLVDGYTLRKELLAGVDGIDLFMIETFADAGYGVYRSGVMEDLAAYPPIREILEDPRLLEGVLEPLTVEGVLVGMPDLLACKAWFANASVIQEAGLPWPEADWDWYDFFAWMEQAGDALEGGMSFSPLPGGNSFFPHWPVFFDDYVVSYFDPEAGTIAFDTQEFRELMELWRDFAQNPWLQEETKDARRVALRQSSLYPCTPFTLAARYYGETEVPERAIAAPQFRGRETYYSSYGGYTSYLSLYSRSENKELAVDFLAFLMSYDQRHTVNLFRENAVLYQISSLQDYPETAFVEEQASEQEFLETGYPLYQEVLPRMRLCPLSMEMRTALETVIAAYMQGQITLDELVAGLTEKAEMMLR